jgi:16S rRNA (uracil1498-N3)-methyltransferase
VSGRLRRFFVRPEAVDGDHIRFDATEVRHLTRVLRLGPGARVEAADGTGRGFVVRVVTVGPAGGVGQIEGETHRLTESPCVVTLAPAILKGDRMGWLIQKATELGVARIVPIETTRGVVQGTRAEQQRARWARVAHEAMKQCGRAVAPTVETPRRLGAAIEEVPDHDAAWLFDEAEGEPVSVAARLAGRPRRLLLLVGAEGGFTEDEVARGRDAGARVVSLGPRTLRAESAGVVAVTLGQHLFGDLR